MTKYQELLENKDYETLSNINFIDELTEYKYQDKCLIEYLLAKGIHSEKMDEFLKYHDNFLPFYLKYNIIKPLLNCSLKVLFKKLNGELYFDLILDKLETQEKIELYYNIRKSSYNDFHYLERDVIDVYLRHGIILPIMFITTKLDKIDDSLIDDEIFIEFKKLFQNTDTKLLNYIINEFKRCLLKDRERTLNDIKKLIKYKKDKPFFTFYNSTISDNHGCFDPKKLELSTDTVDSLKFNHEFSHLLFYVYENDSIINEYENIRLKLDTENNYLIVKKYLEMLHHEFDNEKKQLEYKYDEKIKEFYGSFSNYFKKIYLDLKDNTPDFIKLKNLTTDMYVYASITPETLKDICLSFIEIEKQEYIALELNKNNSPYLMLENMLDAIFNGKLFDDFEFNCLSGHGSFYFLKNVTNSFDECLANFDAIKKSDKGKEVVKILRELIGNELIDFLNNYIKKNREESYASR